MNAATETFAEFDSVIARVADTCGVPEECVEIAYMRKGTERWFTVRVSIERKAARIYKNATVSGDGETPADAADAAIQTVRFHVSEGTHRTPGGVKVDAEAEAQAEAERLRNSLIRALMEANDLSRGEAETRVDAHLASKAD